tara:strand:- start:3407 stop:3826 length:420 start_codon:yes stop_codon:yes gene_type:complete
MVGKKVKLRIIFLSIFLITIILSLILILKSLENEIVYFISPTEIKNLSELDKNKIRVGGMVKEGSIKAYENNISFVITDFKNEITVSFTGAIPNLFAEGKGVVAEGILRDRNYLVSKKILAKHDENYIPPEVKEALEKK